MSAVRYSLIALIATALGTSTISDQSLEKSTCGRVWITVHSPEIRVPLRNTLVDALELNWSFTGCFAVPEKIGLFESRPLSWISASVVYPVTSEKGFVITNVSLGEAILPAGWEDGAGLKGPQCLWPWVGAGNEKISAYNCLKIQPTWMEDNGDKINKLRIGELALAGTHNAGAWRYNTETSSLARDTIVLCQDRSIWAQLVHGIRYLDFRIGYYGTYSNMNDRYWLNHDYVKIRPLVPLLREIRVFLDATKEIIFLDAHHFPVGFYDNNDAPILSVHNGLLEIIQRELGPHLAYARDFAIKMRTRGPTVQQLLDAEKRLLFSYNDGVMVNNINWLWPNIPHLWARTSSPTKLLQYLDNAMTTSPDSHALPPLYSAMAQTTPNILDFFFASIRSNADAVNRKVTERLMTLWRQGANIVSTDFFLGNDVIDVSIAICLERSV